MKLPIRAMVALSARGARRAQTRFDDPAGLDIDTILAHRRTIDQAIEFVEAATGEEVSNNLADAAMAHRKALAGPIKDDKREQNQAVIANYAIVAVFRLAEVSSADTYDAASTLGSMCANAVSATLVALAGDNQAAIKAIHSDYACLVKLTEATGDAFPEIGELVDTSEDGPIGPLWLAD